jgi:hypothetical protein
LKSAQRQQQLTTTFGYRSRWMRFVSFLFFFSPLEFFFTTDSPNAQNINDPRLRLPSRPAPNMIPTAALLVLVALLRTAIAGCNVTTTDSSGNNTTSVSPVALSSNTEYRINGSECSSSVTFTLKEEGHFVVLGNISIVQRGGAYLSSVDLGKMGTVSNLSIHIDGVVMTNASMITSAILSTTSLTHVTLLSMHISNSVVFGGHGTITDISLVQLQGNTSGANVTVMNTTMTLHNRLFLVVSNSGTETFQNVSVVIINSSMSLGVDFSDPTAFAYHKALISVCLNCVMSSPTLSSSALLTGFSVLADHVNMNATVTAQYTGNSSGNGGVRATNFWDSGAMNGTDFRLLLRVSAQHCSVKDLIVQIKNSSVLSIYAVGNLLQYNNGQLLTMSGGINASASIELGVVFLDLNYSSIVGARICLSDSIINAASNEKFFLMRIGGTSDAKSRIDDLEATLVNLSMAASVGGAVSLWCAGRGIAAVLLMYLNITGRFHLVVDSVRVASTMEFGCRNCRSQVLRSEDVSSAAWQQFSGIVRLSEIHFLSVGPSSSSYSVSMKNATLVSSVLGSNITNGTFAKDGNGGGYLEFKSFIGVVLLTAEVLAIILCNVSSINVSMVNISALSSESKASGMSILTNGTYAGFFMSTMSIMNLCSSCYDSVISLQDTLVDEFHPMATSVVGPLSQSDSISVGYSTVMASYPPTLVLLLKGLVVAGTWHSTTLSIHDAGLNVAEAVGARRLKSFSFVILPEALQHNTTIALVSGAASSSRVTSRSVTVVMCRVGPSGTTLLYNSSIRVSGYLHTNISSVFGAPSAVSTPPPGLTIDNSSTVHIDTCALTIVSNNSQASYLFACPVAITLGGAVHLSSSSISLQTVSPAGPASLLQMFKHQPTLSPNHIKSACHFRHV